MMNTHKSTFALFFGNRGFFPASLVAGARDDLPRVLNAMGHETLMLDAAANALRRGRNDARRGNLRQLFAAKPG